MAALQAASRPQRRERGANVSASRLARPPSEPSRVAGGVAPAGPHSTVRTGPYTARHVARANLRYSSWRLTSPMPSSAWFDIAVLIAPTAEHGQGPRPL